MVGLEMESPMNLCKACIICGSKENLHFCSSCSSVFYCPKHEKNNSDSHAEICPPFKIMGDIWVAARDLHQGALVFLDTKARFMINGESKQRSRKIMSRVFPYSHSCLPNCRVDSFPDKNKEIKQPISNLSLNQNQNRGGIVVIRTILPVQMGEKLTVENHGAKDSDVSIHYRRLLMLDMDVYHQDICSCSSRCTDPTENDSFTSGITCPKCFHQNSDNNNDNFGYFLPLHPLNFHPNSPWKCNSCGEVQPAIKMMARVKSIYDNFLPLWPVKLMDLKLEFQESLLDQLEQDEKIVGKYGIHPNHWILYQARCFLLYKQQTSTSSKVLDMNFDLNSDPIRSIKIDEMTNLPLHSLTTEQFERLEKCVKRREFLLRVNEKRSPGWTKNRGTNLWHLWLGKFILANQFKIGDMTFEQLKSALNGTKEALMILQEGVEIRRFEINPKDTEAIQQFNTIITKEIEKTENRVKILQQLIAEDSENNGHENNNNNNKIIV